MPQPISDETLRRVTVGTTSLEEVRSLHLYPCRYDEAAALYGRAIDLHRYSSEPAFLARARILLERSRRLDVRRLL